MSRPIRKTMVEQTGTPEAFHDAMMAVVQQHSLQYFVVTYFPEAAKPGLIDNMVTTNWPKELLGRYENTDMFRQSRIVAALQKSILPISSETLLHARGNSIEQEADPLAFYYSDGFSNTVGLSLHDATRRQYLLMLSGRRRISSDEEIGFLIVNAMRALDRFNPCEHMNFGLSSRELDCLRWSAAGKSSEDIAIILALSAHTVNTYLKTAMRKLDTVNRVQAVAMAGRLRLI